MRTLITGATGQDGTILATSLLRESGTVIAVTRILDEARRFIAYCPQAELVACDMGDVDALRNLVIQARPDFLFNLGGFTAPGESWDRADEVWRINTEAVAAILDGIRSIGGETRLFQASSSHVFEGTDRSPQDESFDFSPNSPYARSKAAAMMLIQKAREEGIFAVSGVMYNHESPLRGENFVTRKITMAVARIAAGVQDHLELGDIEVARDWGWAPDYVRAMQLMLEAPSPRDYVLATGISHRLSYFIAKAFQVIGVQNWQDYVRHDSDLDRLADTNKMVGDSRAAYQDLAWRHTVDFDSIARRMVEHDMRLLEDPQALWMDF